MVFPVYALVTTSVVVFELVVRRYYDGGRGVVRASAKNRVEGKRIGRGKCTLVRHRRHGHLLRRRLFRHGCPLLLSPSTFERLYEAKRKKEKRRF
jgi:hypothetical protein